MTTKKKRPTRTTFTVHKSMSDVGPHLTNAEQYALGLITERELYITNKPWQEIKSMQQKGDNT